MQSFESLLSFVGLSVNSPEVRDLVQSENLEVSSEEDLEEGVPVQQYLSSRAEGYIFTFVNDQITTLFVFNEPSDGYTPFCGEFPIGLSPTATRQDVRRVFKNPERSGTAKSILEPNRTLTWDRFVHGALRLHFQYVQPNERISQITVMLATIAP